MTRGASLSSLRFDSRALGWQSTVALALLIAAFGALIAYQGSLPGSQDNARTEQVERLAYELAPGARGVEIGPGNAIVLGRRSRNFDAYAAWTMRPYEFAHVLPSAVDCTMNAYVSGPNASGADANARAAIAVDGVRIGDVRFGGISADYPIVRGRAAPANVRPARLHMTPLFSPPALVFPLPSRLCKADRWTVSIALRGARWPIDRVGIVAHYSPAKAALRAGPPTFAAALALVLALVFATHALFDTIARRYGPLALLLTLGIFACALVTHDEWDFPVWLRFVDLIAFAHADPAYVWSGTPLWPLALGAIAPVISSAFALSGDASQEIAALFLKLAMALATCGNAVVLCGFARPALRRFLFPVLLLSPYALYELAGGYREIFAGSCFVAGAALALRHRYTFAALAFAAAVSISESLAPLLFLPAALRLATSRVTGRSLALAIGDACAAIVPLTFEWLVLVPHSVVATTLATRVVAAYRFGGGSWLSTLDGFGILPAWVGPNSTAIVVGLFALLAAPLVARIVRDVFGSHASEDVQQKRVFGAFAGLVTAFFLAYRGVDASTWYTLWIVVAFYFVRFEPTNPFPIFISTMLAVAFYAILGIGDFANATYVMPSNQSLLGVLGRPMLVTVFAANLTILAFYVACVSRDRVPLFGRGSTSFLVLYFGAVGAGAIAMYPVDIVFCSCAAIGLTIAFARLLQVHGRRYPWRRLAVLDYIGLASVVVCGAAGGTQNPAAALGAFVALLLGLTYGFGACDVVLAIGATFLVGTQYGFGWVSIAGYIVLSLMAVASIATARAATLVRNA